MLDAVPPKIHELRKHFQAAGKDIRPVGGWVRDYLMGREPKDLDLCTDADPFAMVAIFTTAGVRYRNTGLQHGTVTAIMGPGEGYEITSLRLDTETDGRHAKVKFTTDWEADLARRDLTINAISMTLDGEIVDPFGGAQDLKDQRIRFVGNPVDRMREDYLRILRWLRFHYRIAPDQPLDPETCDAARQCAHHLKDISRERVWSEVSRFVAGPRGYRALADMMRLGLSYPSGLPHGSWREVKRIHAHTQNPVTLMTAFLIDPARMGNLADRWKWSNTERELALFLAENMADDEIDLRRLLADDRRPLASVRELAILQGRHAEIPGLEAWDVPYFPVKGEDLLRLGFRQGPELGQHLASLRTLWADSDYGLSKDDLLARMRAPVREVA